MPEKTKEIYFAGGCFWGVEAYFSRIPGVISASSGYANGETENPSYEDVCHRASGHAETVQVKYNPSVVGLKTLVRQFFKIIDPLSWDGQGPDRGPQYRSGIYYTDPSDWPAIESVMREIEAQYNEPLAVELGALKNYYPAEEYHQKYLEKNPRGYCHINFSSLNELPPPGSELD